MNPHTSGQPSSGASNEAAQVARSLCIVVADDDRDAVLSLTMLLQVEGHQVHCAYEAKQALDQVLRHDPDVLLLDIALGRGSGFQVAHTIRARHGYTRPMIIGLSGVYKKSSDRILANINGFDHYLVKPYNPQDLLGFLAPLRLPRRRAEDDLEHEQTYRVALARAAGLLGSTRELSVRLQVPMPELTRWLAGNGKPPLAVFLRVVDILIQEGSRVSPGIAAAAKVIDLPETPDSAAD